MVNTEIHGHFQKNNRIAGWFTAALILLILMLRVPFLTADCISLDEPFMLYHSQKSWSGLWDMLRDENNPPLYFLFMHFWIKLFGTGAFFARLPSLIFSVLGAVVLFRTGFRFFSLRTGIIAALICAGSTFHMYYAHDARVYALFFLLSACSLHYFLEFIIEKKGSASILMLAISNILVCYSHFFGFVVIASQVICLLLIPSLRINIKNYSIVLLSLIAAYSFYFPVLFHRFIQSKGGTWIQKPVFSDLYNMLWIFTNVPVVTFLAIIVLFIGFYKSAFGKRRTEKEKVIIISFLFSLLIPFIISFFIPVFIDRYFIFITAFYYSILSFTLDSLFPKNLFGWIAALALPAAMIATLNLNPSKKRNIEALVMKLKSVESPGQMILISPAWLDLNFVYYYRPEWFNNVNNLKEELNRNNIYTINDAGQLPADFAGASSVLFVIESPSIPTSIEEDLVILKKEFPQMQEFTFRENLHLYRLSR